MVRVHVACSHEGGIAGVGFERDTGLRDVDVEHAVAVVLELESAELGQLPGPDHLDPLDLPAARLASACPVQTDVPRQCLDRGPGLLVGEAESPVPCPQLWDSRDERLRERIVLESKLH